MTDLILDHLWIFAIWAFLGFMLWQVLELRREVQTVMSKLWERDFGIRFSSERWRPVRWMEPSDYVTETDSAEAPDLAVNTECKACRDRAIRRRQAILAGTYQYLGELARCRSCETAYDTFTDTRMFKDSET